MLRRFGAEAWLTPAKQAGYLAAWSAPGALRGMRNWYRATPLLVPKPASPSLRALPKLDPATLRVRMPQLLIWGMKDTALLPVSWASLQDYCEDLVVREIASADHWLVHQKTEAVTRLIGAVLQG